MKNTFTKKLKVAVLFCLATLASQSAFSGTCTTGGATGTGLGTSSVGVTPTCTYQNINSGSGEDVTLTGLTSTTYYDFQYSSGGQNPSGTLGMGTYINGVSSRVIGVGRSPAIACGSWTGSSAILQYRISAPTCGAASATPTVCTGLSMTAVTHATKNVTAVGVATGLPPGVTASYAGDVVTISGTPTTGGTYAYSIALTNLCSATLNATGTITVTAAPTASLSYSGSPWCKTAGTQSPSLSGTNAYTGGTYSSTPAGLTINASSGVITPSTSTAGTYNVTYATPSGGGCSSVNSNTVSVTVTAAPTATISYSGSPWCTSAGTQSPSLSGTNAYTGGTYTSTPAGLTINSSTGVITPSSSTAGTYSVTYATPSGGGCSSVNSNTVSVTVTAPPTASLSYSGSPWCKTAGTQSPSLSGTNAYTGGTYSSTAGLTINASTGVITPSTSTAGTYSVTYATPIGGGCSSVNSNTVSVTVTAAPTATISYSGSPWCTTAGSQSVSLSGTNAYTGGTYTSTPAGLTINSSTGAIDPSTSTAGTYSVTYATPIGGGCSSVNSNTATVTVTAPPTATLSYSGSPWCTTAGAQSPTLSGTNAYTGGTYSSTAGLTINSSTGSITPSTSTAGTYNVTYATPIGGGCSSVNSNTVSVTVTAAPTATLSYAGTPFCKSLGSGQTSSLSGTGAYTGGTYSSTPSGLDLNSSSGDIDPSASTAGTYSVTYTTPASGGCSAVATSPATTVRIDDVSVGGTTIGNTVVCVGNSVTLGLTGNVGSTYQWQSSPDNITYTDISGANSASYATSTGLAVGTYYFRAQVSNGSCAADPSVELQLDVYPVLANNTISSSQGVCTGDAPLAFTGSTPTGGNGSYAYQWQISTTSGSSGFSNISGATSKDLTYVTGISVNTWFRRRVTSTCQDFSTAIQVTPSVISNNTISAAQSICPGVVPSALSGSSPAGATLSYTYLWEESTTSALAGFGSASGTNTGQNYTPGALSVNTWYRRTVYSGSCTNTSTAIQITIYSPPTAAPDFASNPICATRSTVLSANATAGSGAITTYAWSSGIAGNNASGSVSVAGPFTVTVTDNNTCTVAATSPTLGFYTNPTASPGFGTDPICAGATSLLSANATPGSGSITTYAWSSGIIGNNASGNVSTAGPFTVTVTDNNSCTVAASTGSLGINANPTAAPDFVDNPACNGSGTTIDAYASAGSGTITSYAWSSTLGNVASGTVTTAGTYTVTVTNSNSCTVAATSPSLVLLSSSANMYLFTASKTALVEQCTESGWSYFSDPADDTKFLFAIKKNGNSATFTVDLGKSGSTYDLVERNIGTSPTMPKANFTMGRYWNVAYSGTIGTPVDVRFFYNPSDLSAMSAAATSWASANPTSLSGYTTKVFGNEWFKVNSGAYDPANNTWSDVGAHSLYSPGSGTINSVTYAEYTGITSFSGGTVGIRVAPVPTGNSPIGLPVEWLYFSARATNNYIQLDWATASEINNKGFEVERSDDGLNFTKIGWVEGNNNSSQTLKYSYDDKDVVPNRIYYYRLRQIDNDGQEDFSQIVSARIREEGGFEISELVPNPAQNKVNIYVSTQTDQTVKLKLTDLLGQEVVNKDWLIKNGTNGVEIDLRDVASGTYSVTIISGNAYTSKKLLITK